MVSSAALVGIDAGIDEFVIVFGRVFGRSACFWIRKVCILQPILYLVDVLSLKCCEVCY